MRTLLNGPCWLILMLLVSCSANKKITRQAGTKEQVLATINQVNTCWQRTHPEPGRSFWDNAAYHTGNMEAYYLTRDEGFRKYSETWAERNNWLGATADSPAIWKYSYGEKPEYVLFGDWQVCFQTYIDLYNLDPDERKVARAKEVMRYQVGTDRNDYWWWADGLYMVMPVMVKMYKLTGEKIYLQKMHEYYLYANSIMYDSIDHMYYRDAKYIYPKHTTKAGRKDFWARGNGWVFAALAKVLKDLPADDPYSSEYIELFKAMAATLKKLQQPKGYWTRSMMDEAQSPGYETSGTAFFTYGMLWGINNGILDKNEYLPVALKGWHYLSYIALQPGGKIGYVQPIGEKAIPGQVIDKNSTASFGVGAFLLAACELYRLLDKNS